jgi:phospholipase/carboxylesterase
MSGHPHADTPTESVGADLTDATAAVVALHGRGARPGSVLAFAEEVPTEAVAWRAPAAARHTWYPQSFLEPIEANQPDLESALARIEAAVETVRDAGVARDRIVLLGFSQGACLATEFAARNPTRYGGVVGFSGGLIGPEGTDFSYEGSLSETPVFLGCSDRDPHIPEERVQETADALAALGADVDTRIYQGMGHTVNREEAHALADIVAAAAD